MANAKVIQLLDEKLINDNIIDESYIKDYAKVHKFLNSHIHKHGQHLPDETFQRVDSELRKWLDTLSKQGASQEKLTSYLRCGLAHLSFDYIDSAYEKIEADALVTRALISFKQRGFQKSYYKPHKEPASKKSTKKSTSVVAIKRAKKSSKKKAKPLASKNKVIRKVSKKAAKKRGTIKK